MTKPVTVYVTTKDEQEARRLGRLAVERRLAACANVIPAMHSIYQWENRVVEHPEAVVLFKTDEAKLEQLTAVLVEHHSYSVPCVVAWPIVGGNEPYIAWIRSETAADALPEPDPKSD